MNVNILIFRSDMTQPPSKKGEVSEIIPMNESVGSGVDFINGDIHFKLSVTGTNELFCEELKSKTKKLDIKHGDDFFSRLVDGTLVVTHEELHPHVVGL